MVISSHYLFFSHTLSHLIIRDVNIKNNSRQQKLIGMKNGSAVTFECHVPRLDYKTSQKLYIPNRGYTHANLSEPKSVVKDY